MKRKLDRVQKASRGGDKALAAQGPALEALLAHLEEGKSARAFEWDAEARQAALGDMPLLSDKPVIYAANMSENDFKSLESNVYYQEVEKISKTEHAQVFPICARLEEEIAGMSLEDKMLFLEDMGLEQSGLDRLIQEAYALLGLISYLTAGKQEVRAWTIEEGTKAPQAAGKIHSDFEKGFIRAEIVAFDELKDGDVVLFRFNV